MNPGGNSTVPLSTGLIRSVDHARGYHVRGELPRTGSQRTQIFCYWSFPQLRSTEDRVAIPTGHIEFQEGALSAGTLK